MPCPAPPSTDPEATLELTIFHHGKPHTFTFPSTATITDLSISISTTLSIPPTNQKYIITPKTGVLKPPFPNPTLPLTTLVSKKITLLGTTASEITTLNTSISNTQSRLSNRTHALTTSAAKPTRHHRSINQVRDEATYTFHTLRPLPYLPNPSRSLTFLTRLSTDPGIRAAMLTHKFSVALLTEMDPGQHTTRDSRTLGLNRNRGEVIELRLRTDAYDGYRDYKTIRRTLCHELAHNVYGEHDADFWALCRRIEGEVERGDWRSGGRAVSGEIFYDPAEGQGGEGQGEHVDHGGWSGGEFVLGAGGPVGGDRGTGTVTGAELSRRDILARAAEERMRKQRAANGGSGDEGTSS
ncbi:hypothetical protein MMC16_003074 [Acarospora aff. strigata]|nr:hypothetical protein [Acarospora aff. strigata]